ncbi:hypothetical protein A3D81_03165 [Candidatus Curtissbacteria bacterium RIFCSPHIGHO2_02_FULL_40_17]|uniref:EamA domain-containing protein n=4 Tax=Candidatus Curtissiibacteriota TaxID=1752717 RepID=A0A1F5GJK0_9BACT|nr:MAG: hypothetical protein A3D81_03165 [Candidatus Curtissbacteria bacterium RIFCSPHIGHO2_02_FULL_40_17]OGE05602.1 MAG: hypothetical protein A3F45_00090 [Candidatus Curtissbacteria bacterium RIFCSPHIGHO2_12_FULL_41_17]OGE07347.1 MAG: hypothetical protein A3I53_01995 [Candidatus Curtissbacteria bacterium RIFCSPLOWO2_02_FULL_40_13b]
MPAIFFALISFLGWGIGDIFGTVATRKIGAYSTTFWYILLQVPIFAIGIPFFTGHLQNLTLEILILNTTLGLIGTIGLVAFYEGLKVGNAALVGTIAASFAALTVLLSIIFLGESVSLQQSMAIVIIFIGLIGSTLDIKSLISRKLIVDKGIWMGAVAMLSWGIYWAFIKIPIKELGWFWPGYISILASLPGIWLFIKLREIKLTKLNFKGSFYPLFANALLLGVGALSFNLAIEKGFTSIVAPIAGSYPTIFVLLAYLIFRDPITRQQIAGIIITLFGIVMLSVFSI